MTWKGVHVGNHSFWWITNSVGTDYILAGGPQSGYLHAWAVQGFVGHYKEDNVDTATVQWSSQIGSKLCSPVAWMYSFTVNWPQAKLSTMLKGRTAILSPISAARPESCLQHNRRTLLVGSDVSELPLIVEVLDYDTATQTN